MPWVTPTLEQLRDTNKANIQSQLRSGPMIPNSVMRVMADSNAGLAYLTLLYINWLSLQLMPDTAEKDFLDRFGSIWLTQGRKAATFASATVQASGTAGAVVQKGAILNGGSDVLTGQQIQFAVTANATLGSGPTNVSVAALSPGATGLVVTISAITDGIESETDDELRVRVLDRIRQPPVGGDANDFVQWAMATPGVNVTRAWCSPLEMGIGTVTIRFMTDDLVNNIVGFPSAADIATVQAYIDTVRPVAIKDRFVVAPVKENIDFVITNLSPDTVAVRSAIAVSVAKMLFDRAAPAHAVNGVEQPATTIYSSWVSEAIADVQGINTFTLTMQDHVMPYNASLAVLGTVVYG